MVLWIGDLNYRISDLDVDNVKELISKKDFETLHSYDQVIPGLVLSSHLVSPYSRFVFTSTDGMSTLHMVLSSRGRSMRMLCLLALWRVRLISSPPTNMTPALIIGTQGNVTYLVLTVKSRKEQIQRWFFSDSAMFMIEMSIIGERGVKYCNNETTKFFSHIYFAFFLSPAVFHSFMLGFSRTPT